MAANVSKFVQGLSALCLVALLTFAGQATVADEVRTEWINPEVGAFEGVIGARIRSIEELPDDEGQRVVIEIPREALEYREAMPEIVVTARRPDESEARLAIPHEWLADYDNDNYGLVLYLGPHGNLPLRIYFSHPPR